MLSVEQAQARILARVPRLSPERVSINDALGRVLAQSIVATRDLPPFDNSAMDGYAVRTADLLSAGMTRLKLVGESRAGASQPLRLGQGEAARVLTGAPVPIGADAVVVQEHSTIEGDWVVIERTVSPGENIRRAGEDLPAGTVPLAELATLGPGEVGLLAALGIGSVPVFGRPRVAILATGDELREVDEPLGFGQIVTSNSYSLAAQVREAGAEPVLLGIARDDEDDLRARIARGLKCDLCLTSGGVSVGDYDLVRKVLDSLGWQSEFWKVRMKPGKPLAFGVLSGVPIVGLPGNPASCMVAFELFVRPALRAMAGHPRPFRAIAVGRLVTGYKKDDDRAHLVRCGASDQRGELYLRPLPKQGSGMLTSLVGVSALAIIDGPPVEIPAGGRVPAMILEGSYAERAMPGLEP